MAFLGQSNSPKLSRPSSVSLPWHPGTCRRLDQELKAYEEEKQLCILPQDPETPRGTPDSNGTTEALA